MGRFFYERGKDMQKIHNKRIGGLAVVLWGSAY
jgi:hypothetical protein